MNLTQMKERLQAYFKDGSVEVIDLTGTENHYEVMVESKNFLGRTRIQQHQEVMQVFADELKSGEVHALSIKTKIKSE